MHRIIFIPITIFFSSCATTTSYYVVRHAEKEAGTTMAANTTRTSDVPLSEQGMRRAEELRNQLQDKTIKHIYSTNTVRTKSTVEPLSKSKGIAIEIYDSVDSIFLGQLKNSKGNVLIVGHSNTVDDLVNELAGKKILSNLPDTQYGDIFIVHRKRSTIKYETKRFD